MTAYRTAVTVAWLFLVPGCLRAPEQTKPPGAEVVIEVAPLTLPGVTDVTYTLTVVTASETIWTRQVSSSQFGDGAGALSYVGPCDGTVNPNTVQLVVDAIQMVDGALVEGVDFANPAPAGRPLERDITCTPDTDTRVTFDITVARAARQGFFDVGVEFEDIFCSAKLDCVKTTEAGTEPLELLFNPHTNVRERTAVVALACTAGPDAGDTWLHMDDLVVTCAGGQTFSVSPNLGPGNLSPSFPGPPNTADLFFQTAVFRGYEPLAGANKGYWNVALGLNADAFDTLGPCTLHAAATATDGNLTNGATRVGATWPYIEWNVTLVDVDGDLACTSHAHGDGSGVTTAYTGLSGRDFDASFWPAGGLVFRNHAPDFPGGLTAPSTGPSAFGHTIDGSFTGYPAQDHEWSDITPVAGPDADRFYFDYDGSVLTGILEGFSCPAALDSDEGVHLAISTDNGAVGWQLYVTRGGGVVSAIRNGVDVTASALADAAIDFAVSPNSPGADHYMLELAVPAGWGGFSYRIVGADAGCAVPTGDVIVYGWCSQAGGVEPPPATAPRAGQPPPGPVFSGGWVPLPGHYAWPPASVAFDGAPVGSYYIEDDTIVVRAVGGEGPHTVRVCYDSGGCVEHTIIINGGGGVSQPAVVLDAGEVDGRLTPTGGGLWFDWARGLPVAGSRSRVCSCGYHGGTPCAVIDWHDGTFADADKLIVYGGTADGGRLAIVGSADGSVAAWLDGQPVADVVGAVSESHSPWEGGPSLVMEVCLSLPWTEYNLAVTGPCAEGLCDDDVVVDVTAWGGGRHTLQTAIDEPRIVFMGPGTDVLAAARSGGVVGDAATNDAFVARGANLGASAGTVHFTGATLASGLTWSEAVVTGVLPTTTQDGGAFLRTAGATDTNTVTIDVDEAPTSCPAGTWGLTCQSSCVQGDCTGVVSCDQADGANRVCTGCSPGYWGDDCASSCAQGDCTGVVSCNQADGSGRTCTGCSPGYWGDDCTSSCAQGDCTGIVSCNQADGSDRTCSGCSSGFWGDDCASSCAQGDCIGAVTCDQADGAGRVCVGCVAGRWGIDCTSSCTQGSCTGTVSCDQADGTSRVCTGCEPGYWGTDCTSSCSQGSCTGTVSCNQSDGAGRTCTGCTAGWYGTDCSSVCVQGNCTGVVSCTQAGGGDRTCSACDPGYWGAGCTSNCAQGNCTGVVSCDQSDGTGRVCTGCAAGFWDTDCAATCVQGDCAGTVSCDQSSGADRTCTGCNPGHWGGDCTSTCLQGNCTGTVSCAQSDGGDRTCTGCNPGYWSDDCTSTCLQGNCTSTVTCRQGDGTGRTCSGCEAGWWDTGCEAPCTQGNCSGAVSCTQVNGGDRTCISCVAGWYGSGCTTACASVSQCAVTVTCTNGTNAYCATCNAGRAQYGLGQACVDIDGCVGDPCSPVTCFDVAAPGVGYTCSTPDATSDLSCSPSSPRIGAQATCTITPRQSNVIIDALASSFTPSATAGSVGGISPSSGSALQFTFTAPTTAQTVTVGDGLSTTNVAVTWPASCGEYEAMGYDLTGSYTIDPDGPGGDAPITLECLPNYADGGWNQATADYLATLSTGQLYEYLYTNLTPGLGWYRSPPTTQLWDWNSYYPQVGPYAYSTTGGELGSFDCPVDNEPFQWGVGCSNGGGPQQKVAPAYWKDEVLGQSQVCQDAPAALGPAPCVDAQIWIRPAKLYPEDCATIQAEGGTLDATYTVDADGLGGAPPAVVSCLQTVDGGGWTAATPNFLAGLPGGTYEYLYTNDPPTSPTAAWFKSPATSFIWNWTTFQPVTGTYRSQTTDGVAGTVSCPTSNEVGSIGIGCSTGGGNVPKIITNGAIDPGRASAGVCQAYPGPLGPIWCHAGLIWVREVP